MKRYAWILAQQVPVVLLLLVLTSCAGIDNSDDLAAESESLAGTMTVTSEAFARGAPIPEKYTCDGDDISPPLSWDGVPNDVAGFALIVDDPDAPRGTWVHWVLFNLPSDTRSLPEGAAEEAGRSGTNSWRRVGYGGPCPPGGEHRYFFKLYALDTMLDLDAGADKAELEGAMEGHVLAQGQLMGTYAR